MQDADGTVGTASDILMHLKGLIGSDEAAVRIWTGMLQTRVTDAPCPLEYDDNEVYKSWVEFLEALIVKEVPQKLKLAFSVPVHLVLMEARRLASKSQLLQASIKDMQAVSDEKLLDVCKTFPPILKNIQYHSAHEKVLATAVHNCGAELLKHSSKILDEAMLSLKASSTSDEDGKESQLNSYMLFQDLFIGRI
jgi:hypothetical protein